MTTKIETCPKPKCNGKVGIFPSYGGARGERTVYFAECSKCGAKVDHLGMGPMRSAIKDWNKYAMEVRAKLASSTGDNE